MKKVLLSMLLLFAAFPISAAWPGKAGEWHGCPRYDFQYKDRDAIVVVPEKPLPGNPWVLRPAFFDSFPSIDKALLEKGFHIAFFNVTNEWGRPSAMKAMKEFVDFAAGNGLMSKPVLLGQSRGGYNSLAWAERYPESTAAILLDNPLVDIFELDRNEEWAADYRKKWLDDTGALPGMADNAINNLTPLIDNEIPVVILSGGCDTIVPFVRNGRIVKDAYRRHGLPVKWIVRSGGAHHPHGLDNPAPVAEFLTKAVYDRNGAMGKGKKRVACIGDSMSEGVGTNDFATESYPAQLGLCLGADFEVRNFGVSCATLVKNGTDAGRPFGYSRLPAYQEVIKYQPDIVIIALGVNDCKTYNWDPYGKEFVADYQSMIDELKRIPSIPEIYLVVEPYVTVTPQTQSWGFENNGNYEDMVSKIHTVAAVNGLKVIDISNVFEGERVGCYAPNDHPNPRGAAMMAREVAKHIDR